MGPKMLKVLIESMFADGVSVLERGTHAEQSTRFDGVRVRQGKKRKGCVSVCGYGDEA